MSAGAWQQRSWLDHADDHCLYFDTASATQSQDTHRYRAISSATTMYICIPRSGKPQSNQPVFKPGPPIQSTRLPPRVPSQASCHASSEVFSHTAHLPYHHTLSHAEFGLMRSASASHSPQIGRNEPTALSQLVACDGPRHGPLDGSASSELQALRMQSAVLPCRISKDSS